MIVLVTGGRNYSNIDAVNMALDQLHAHRPITVLIHGGATGADAIAGRWGRINDVRVECYIANWLEYGRHAGPIRNQKMIDVKPDLVVAFPGGAGTRDLVSRAKRAGIEIKQVTS